MGTAECSHEVTRCPLIAVRQSLLTFRLVGIKSVGFPPRRPIPLPRIDSGLSSDAKYGGFER